MPIQEVLLSSLKDDKKSEYFYNFCKLEAGSDNLKQLLSNSTIVPYLNIRVLSWGLVGALESGNKEIVANIGAYILNNNVLLEIAPEKENDSFFVKFRRSADQRANLEGLQVIFNAATNNNQIKLAKLFNQKYSILKQSLSEKLTSAIVLESGAREEKIGFKEDGSMFHIKTLGSPVSEFETKQTEYNLNPILFNLKNFNVEVLDEIFDTSKTVDTSVIKSALLMTLGLKKVESLLYLFSNEKSVAIIKNSEEIQHFINCDNELVEEKQIARKALKIINSKQDEKNTVNHILTKPKV